MRILAFTMLGLTALALVSFDEQPEWAGPEKIVFWALMRDADHGQIFIRDERGITQLTALPEIRELWSLDPPGFAFQVWTVRGTDIYLLNADTARYEIAERQAGRVYTVPSPNGEWLIRDESNVLVVSGLQRNVRPRILGRSPGFPMAWSCSSNAVYFRDSDRNRIVKVDAETDQRTDLTPPDWPELDLREFSLSCNERVIAVVGHRNRLRIYKDRRLIKEIEAPDILWPSVSRDGDLVLYIAPHDDETTKVMSYSLETDETTELIGPIAAFGPVFLLDR